MLRQSAHKSLQRRTLPLELQLHAGGGVADRPCETVLAHEPMHKGAEAHPLYDAVNLNCHMLHVLRLLFISILSLFYPNVPRIATAEPGE